MAFFWKKDFVGLNNKISEVQINASTGLAPVIRDKN